MCGIAGLIGAFVPGLAARMNAVQAHRGPNGRGAFEDPGAGVCLGHVRLAILDVTPAAAQPMPARDLLETELCFPDSVLHAGGFSCL
jgi:asparagine synthase (glutamine-hydrolysing)